MKKAISFLLLALVAVASNAWSYSGDALDDIPTLNSTTITSGVAGTTQGTASVVPLSTTAGIGPKSSSSYQPLTVQFSAASAIQYDFGYTTYTPAVLSGYLAASTTALVQNLDPYLVMYIQGTTASDNWRMNIFSVQK